MQNRNNKVYTNTFKMFFRSFLLKWRQRIIRRIIKCEISYISTTYMEIHKTKTFPTYFVSLVPICDRKFKMCTLLMA